MPGCQAAPQSLLLTRSHKRQKRRPAASGQPRFARALRILRFQTGDTLLVFFAGARLRLSSGIALEARGGVSLVGFAKPSVEHETGDTTGAYLVRPTDYRTRIWYSAMLSLEVTVMD